jgi:hypothetical protein
MQTFESPIARLRAIYRIPTTADTQRVLELHVGEHGPVVDATWPATSVVSCRLVDDAMAPSASTVGIEPGFQSCDCGWAAPLPFPPGSFDMVVLHFTLDDLAAAAGSRGTAAGVDEWLRRVAQVLRPGGIVAGCAANATSPAARRGRGAGARRGGRPTMSVLTCAEVLGSAGFVGIQVFNLIPDAAEPRAIVASDRVMSRRAFAHEIQSVRESLGFAGLLVRRAMLRLSLHRLVEPAMFYWGTRGC